ncbi:MAG: hypothetical protein ABH864_05185 [archaeon]
MSIIYDKFYGMKIRKFEWNWDSNLDIDLREVNTTDPYTSGQEFKPLCHIECSGGVRKFIEAEVATSKNKIIELNNEINRLKKEDEVTKLKKEIIEEKHKTESLLRSYKSLLTSPEILDRPDLMSKDPTFLEELWQEKKKFKQTLRESREENEDEGEMLNVTSRQKRFEELENLDIESEAYINGNFCFCKALKSKMAKSCQEHWSKAKSISVSKKVGMPEAHKIVFEEYKESLR